MKTVIVTEKKTLENTSGLESVELSIDNKGLVHIMSVLTNLYSSPSTAIFREYVSNAIDSHSKCGQKLPIQVTLPTTTGQNLVIRDYGVGMSKEEIINVYSRYGTSTKRDDNDAIGGFGLGAKSALAMVNRFDVVSIKDGKRVEFYVEKNPQGAGVVYFVSEEDTTEPNGVEVSIPYGTATLTDDFARKFFVGAEKGSIVFDGVPLTHTLDNEEAFTALTDTNNTDIVGWIENQKKDSNSGYYSYDNVMIIIGGIIYNVQPSWISGTKFQSLRTYGHRMFINVPIGAAEMTPSREELIYGGRTDKVLEVAFENFRSAAQVHYQRQMNRVKTHREAIEKRIEFAADSYWDLDAITWRNKKIPTEQVLEKVAYVVTPANAYGAYRQGKNEMDYSIAGSRISFTGANNSGRNTLVLRLDSDSLYEEAVLLRRYAKTIRLMADTTRILLLSETDYNNEWFQWTHHAKFTTVNEVVEAAKAYAKEMRLAEKGDDAPVRRKTTKKVVAQFLHVSEDGTRQVERVFAKDIRLEKVKKGAKAYYLRESNTSRDIFPWVSFADDGPDLLPVTGVDRNGFASIVAKNLNDGVIFLVGSRQSMEKFKAEYPHVINLQTEVTKTAAKLFVPERQVVLTKVTNMLEYGVRAKATRLMHVYTTLKTAGDLSLITNKGFAELGYFCEMPTSNAEVKNDPEQVNLGYWSKYIESNDTIYQEALKVEARKLEKVVEQFWMLASAENAITEMRKQHVIDYINLVAV